MMIKLKTILTEGFAWERKEGKGLPTLAEVQAEYESSHAGGSYESMTDSQLIAAADDAGMEEMVINGPDGLVNRDEIIKSLNGDNSDMQEASGAKPDFLDLDGDGNEEESMKSAANSTKSMNEGFVSRIKKNLIGGDLRK